jgi:hypothetical protein
MSTAGSPCSAYQSTTSDCTSSAMGTVRSTARQLRLRAWPAPVICVPSKIATSIAHRAA